MSSVFVRAPGAGRAVVTPEVFEAVFDASPDAMIVVQADGRVLRANERASAMFGFASGELVGEPAESLLPVRFRGAYAARKDGTLVPAEVARASVPTVSGALVVCVIRDVSERKRAEQVAIAERDAAEARSRELDAFSASAAHDLRAPLRGMSGFARLLLEHHGDALDAEGKDWLDEIMRNAKRMGALIDALLALARVARTEVRRQVVDLSALVRSVLAGLASNEPDRQVEVVVQPGVMTDFDPGLARLLVTNLVENAWKFTGRTAAPRIEFGATRAGDELQVFLRDNGAGFDEAYAAKLFVPFHRLHTSAEFPGTGIGLATVQRILALHGGRIWAEGHVDQGATFHFTLPCARPEARPWAS